MTTPPCSSCTRSDTDLLRRITQASVLHVSLSLAFGDGSYTFARLSFHIVFFSVPLFVKVSDKGDNFGFIA